jgi:hypothetical protein
LKILPYMPQLAGFQTMVILDPNGLAFDAVGAFGLVFHLLFKSGSSYCGGPFLSKLKKKTWNSHTTQTLLTW